jgi:N-acetylglutamate synthase-like GNAT family acetyltransferase
LNIQIRVARASDFSAIKEFDEFLGSREREIEAGTCFVAIAEGDKVIAYASYEPQGLLSQPLLTFLCVHKEARRRGVATSLVKFIQAQARGRILVSSTEDWCIGTQNIFDRLGWKRLGEIAGVNKDGSSEWFYGINLSQ